MKKFVNQLKELSVKVYDGIGTYEERYIQTALGIEFRKNEFEFLREFNIEVFYENFPLALNELDFLVFANKKLDLKEHIIIEVKVSSKISDENRQQLRNYLKSAPLNNSEYLKKINTGIIINFKKTEKSKDGVFEEILDDEKISIEVWEITKKKEFKQITI